MKKTLIALAVAGFSFNAAAVDLADNTGIAYFPTEANVAGVEIGSATPLTVESPAGFSLGQHYVRLDLNNGAKFEDAPSLVNTTDGAAAVYTVAAGGAGESYVIFSSADNAGSNEVDAADVLTASVTVKVANKDAVGVSYSIYETAGNAVQQQSALSTKSGTLLSFVNALEVAAKTAAGSLDIDVATESKKFVGDLLTTDFANLAVTLNANDGNPIQVLANDAPVGVADILGADGKWTLNGDFSFVDALSNTFVVAEDKASAEATFAGAAANVGDITLSVDGETAINDGKYTAVFTPAANTGYTVAPFTFKDAVELNKNGSSETVNLALKPGGAFSNYIRISNTSNIGGKVFVTVINDAGESVSFPLSAVAGQPAEVAAQSSTEQMSIDQVFAAAEAQGLALAGQGKLRLKVDGEFTSIDVQTYTVATDGTSFATF